MSEFYEMQEGFTITAHTGCLGTAPNSLESIEKGIAAGAQIVEFDLRFDPEGEPILSHDKPEEECVPLSAAFDLLRKNPQIRANVDAKETAFLEKVPKLAEEYGVLPQFFFTGIEEKDVPAVREKCPGVPYYLNADVFPLSDMNALAEKTALLGAIGLNISVDSLSPQLVRAFHERNLLVSVWTIDSQKDAQNVLSMFPDNVTSRYPDMIRQMIR